MKYFPTSLYKIRLLRGLLTAVLIFMTGSLPGPAFAAFDPVNDDTDIFLANPNNPAERPNVLIVLDNTANWSRNVDGQAIVINELAALKTVVQNLSNQFNVGLMTFPETGNPNNSVDGGVVRFHVRQMDDDNKPVLADLVGDLDNNNDKSNNNVLSKVMSEAYFYFAGKKNTSSFGKEKADYAGNVVGDLGGSDDFQHEAVSLSTHALPANPTVNSLYNSPISDSCASNFIIFLSNGDAAENASSLADSEEFLADTGYDTSTPIPLTPSGREGNWADEWAEFLANTDVNGTADGSPTVVTYVVEVDPQTSGNNDDHTALVKSMAEKGKGKYFSVTSSNGGVAIVNALNQIFSEIQAVNSVFASTTLPVSVNVRGTNLNQVYIGVFRPDENKLPRWFGNLKAYQLGVDTATSTLRLVDSNGVAAENTTTGFINPNVTSFWSENNPDDFWGFRPSEQNGVGGPDDVPDGDLVEKGGAANKQRADFTLEQLSRNLYTCTSGTTPCVAGDPGSPLADTPFSEANDGINDTTLGLSTKLVTSLTALQSQSVSALSDTRSVSSATTVDPSAAVTLSTLDNGAVTKTVSTLKTNISKSITTLSNSAVTKSISNAVRQNPKTGMKITINGHGYSSGQLVHISGFTGTATDINATWTITVNDVNNFTLTKASDFNVANPAVTTAVAATTSTVVTATVSSHGFANNASVTIAGVTPSTHNATYTINKIDNNTFSYVTAASLAPVTSVSGATASGTSTTATATVTAHGYNTNDVITISGATPSGYNGNFTITKIDANTFTYDVGASLADATGTITSAKGSTLVTATSAAAHGFTGTPTVTISGADPVGYNGTYTIDVQNATQFTFTTASVQGVATAAGIALGGANTTTVTANVPDHGFTTTFSDGNFATTGDQFNITVAGATGTTAGAYNGSNIPAEIIDADTILYETVDASLPDPATGTLTARLSSATAIATVPGHGFSTGQQVTITGATPTSYNRSDVAVTVIDADTLHYPLLTVTAQGAATGTISLGIKTTTAVARLVDHGFAEDECDGIYGNGNDTFGANCTDDAGGGDDVTPDEITITGATPAAFNKTSINVNVIDEDTFSYTLSSAQGNASGTIQASVSSVDASQVTALVNWVRGADNFEDENSDGDFTDIRASIHGDVLHSRPAVVNYNRNGDDHDVFIFYGANDGVFRAVKGGFQQSGSDPLEPGQEVWGFIPEEFFDDLTRLRNNEPGISSSTKKPYFADGSIGVYVFEDPDDGNTAILEADGDRVILFISMHRGARLIYALDVTDPEDPKFMWKRSNNDTGWAELGQTWSVPRVTTISAHSDPVLIFGAGYDALVEDVDTGTITDAEADVDADGNLEVVADTANYERSMGRGIFIVDAIDATVLFQAGPAVSDTGESSYLAVTGMDCSIPADPALITDRGGDDVNNRAYFGDTCGNIWRLDLDPDDVEDSTVTRLAALADLSDLSNTPDDTTDSDSNGLRKFLFPPDVVQGDDFEAVLIGSGDREHPFDEDTVNRFYMIRDTGISTTPTVTDIVESDLFDATSNCIQSSSSCSGTGDEASSSTAAAALDAANGWYITLGDGEKVVGSALTLNNVTFFNTNQPSSGSDGTCSSDLGIARQYLVNYDDATAYKDKNLDGSMTAADRSAVHPGGGYLPSPVPVVVEIDGKIYEGVISGVKVDEPPGTLHGARLRKFWYKEFE